MYLMHKYWARKPHNIIAEYIKHYTKPGDIVLDPFVGSGVTVMEALRLGRRAVGLDLNPMSVLIVQATLLPVSLDELRTAGEAVIRDATEKVGHLYRTECPECHAPSTMTHMVWTKTVDCEACGAHVEAARAGKRGNLYVCPNCARPLDLSRSDPSEDVAVEIRYACPACGKGKKPLDEGDERLLQEISQRSIPHRYPTDEFVPNARIEAYEGLRVCDLYTKRALVTLSTILAKVRQIGDDDLRLCLEFVFTSALAQASRLIPYRGGFATGGPAWTVPGFWVPVKHFEINALNCFSNRLKRVVKGKQHVAEVLPKEQVVWGQSFSDLAQGSSLVVRQQSATDLSEPLAIPDGTVDYIFTDPPYGDSVPYLEYALFWTSWLGLPLDMSNEVVISDSPVRGKDIADYRRLLAQSFAEMYRVLKPDGWLSVTFHNQDIAVWNALVTAAQEAHFEYVNDIYQVPAVVSAKQQLAREGSLTGDIIINFRRPAGVPARLVLGDVDAERVIRDEARQIIMERRGTATRDALVRGVVSALMRAGALHQFRDVNYIDFVLNRYFVKLGSGRWSLKEDDRAGVFAYVPLDERIRWIVQSVLATGPATLDEILVAIFTNLRNGRTPETQEVSRVLRAIAEPAAKQWALRRPQLFEAPGPPGESVTAIPDDEGTEHNRMIALVARLGHRAGFSCHIGKTERFHTPELDELSDIKELRIPGLSPEELRKGRVDQIDAIWLARGTTPVALFEVENTTRAMTCIPRMANLTALLPHLAVPTFIVAPDTLERKVKQELSSPSAQRLRRAGTGGWYYVLYTELLRFSDDLLPTDLSFGTEDLERMSRSVD
jgi:16S rRNA G966 N2-methylase RsmD